MLCDIFVRFTENIVFQFLNDISSEVQDERFYHYLKDDYVLENKPNNYMQKQI